MRISHRVGFILLPTLLVTVRYAKLLSFDTVVEQIHQDETIASGIGVLTALVGAMVDQGADILESLGVKLDRLS
jgi:magnesium transporter